MQNGSPTLQRLIFSGNTALFSGGGVGSFGGSPTLRYVDFIGNVAGEIGGGMTGGGDNTVLTMSYTRFISNTAETGGVFYNAHSSATISYVTFLRNTASLVIGGLMNERSNATISHATFSGNVALGAGSAIANYKCNPTITQVTFSNNRSLNNNDTLANQESSPLIRNSIFWNNSGKPIQNYRPSDAPDVQYSLVQGGYLTGMHILDADPLFVDADGADNIAGTLDDDLRLQAGSPAVDAGNNTFIPADLTDENHNNDVNEAAPFDLDGNARLVGPIVDLGAYERPGLTITSPRPPGTTYGATYTHTFTANSSSATTFAAAGAMPPGLTLTPRGTLSGVPTLAGVYDNITVTAISAQGSNSQSFSITVAKAPLTIRADDKTRPFNTPNPPLTVSYNGFVNGDTAASLDTPASVSTTATLNSLPGTYPIVASDAADTNYQISFMPGQLLVSAARSFLPLASAGQGL